MTRRDWWFGVLAIVAAVLFHALFPRYEWHVWTTEGYGVQAYVRVDRWTGRGALSRYAPAETLAPSTPSK